MKTTLCTASALLAVVLSGTQLTLWLAAREYVQRDAGCARVITSICPALSETARSHFCTDANGSHCYQVLDETGVRCSLWNPEVFKALWALCGEREGS